MNVAKLALFAWVITALLALVTLPAARGAEDAGYPNTPQAVVTAMMDAAVAQDMDKTKTFMSEKFVATAEMLYKEKGGVRGWWASLMKDFTMEKWEFRGAKDVAEENAKIGVRMVFKDGSKMSVQWRLIKKDGRWICDSI